MLVLSRKQGERILIGNDIVLTVVKIDRNYIRIGIEAPESVGVLREELMHRSEARPGSSNSAVGGAVATA